MLPPVLYISSSKLDMNDTLVSFWKPEEQEPAREPTRNSKKKFTNYLTTVKKIEKKCWLKVSINKLYQLLLI